jgi:hypothetical protein
MVRKIEKPASTQRVYDSLGGLVGFDFAIFDQRIMIMRKTT